MKVALKIITKDLQEEKERNEMLVLLLLEQKKPAKSDNIAIARCLITP